MRHLKKRKKLHRKKDQREALLRSLARSLFLKEKIITTKTKAKELSRFCEKSITRAKKGDLSSRRILLKDYSPDLVKKLIGEIASRYKQRFGGYTRVTKLGQRGGDGAEMAAIELIK